VNLQVFFNLASFKRIVKAGSISDSENEISCIVGTSVVLRVIPSNARLKPLPEPLLRCPEMCETELTLRNTNFSRF